MTPIAENQVKVGPWIWTKWPTLPIPTEDFLRDYGARKGPAALHELHAKRELQISKEQHDPLKYGWEAPPLRILRQLLAGTYRPGTIGTSLAAAEWKQTQGANDILALGGNGSGKTDAEAKLAMELLYFRDKQEVRCFSQNEQTSVRYIQRAMFRYMPPHLRRITRQGQTTKISYKEATGFSENMFVLPPHPPSESGGSTALFPTYKAWEQDRKSVEGGECNGLTFDEEIPAELLDTLRFRAHKTGGWVMGGFTPVGGYTETVGQYIEGATILECIPARTVEWNWWDNTFSWGEWLLPADREYVKGCPKGHVPFVLQSGQGKGRRYVVIFPTPFNPYTNVAAIIDGTRGTPVDFILERLWGWPTKLARKAFPNFGPWHIIKRSRMPAMSELTVYHFMDPHGDRNWFMLWLGVDAEDNVYAFREWPDVPTMGEWALPGSKPDGKVGPAQFYGGNRGFDDYKLLILEIEGWRPNSEGVWEKGPDAWNVYDRRMDPRPAGTVVRSAVEAEFTYLNWMSDPVLQHGRRVADGLDISAAPHCGIEDGKQVVSDYLTRGWDPKQDVTPMNQPKFFVVDECENLIWALRTYTGADGDKGACKDPIDCLKGAAKMQIAHVNANTYGGGGGGFGY